MKKIKLINFVFWPCALAPLIPLVGCSNNQSISKIEVELKKKPYVCDTINKDDIEVTTVAGSVKTKVNDWTCDIKLPYTIVDNTKFDINISYLSFTNKISVEPIIPQNMVKVEFIATEGGSISGNTTIYTTKGTKFCNLKHRPITVPNSNWGFDKWLDAQGNEIAQNTEINDNMTIKAKFTYLHSGDEGGLLFNAIKGVEGIIGYGVRLDTDNIDKLNVKDGKYTFPSTHTVNGNEYPVIEIGNNIFAARKDATIFESIKEIVIPSSIKKICGGAFSCDYTTYNESGNEYTKCNLALEKVTFEGTSSIEEIGDYAFKNCYGISEIQIPASVKYINTGVFDMSTLLPSQTPKLATVTFANNSKLIDIQPNAFGSCKSIESITLHEGIKSLSGFNNTSLTSITIPASVTSINNDAFADVVTLNTVTFNQKATTSQKDWEAASLGINDKAFYNTSIKTIEIPSYCTHLRNSVFEFSKLETITFKKNDTYGMKINIIKECCFKDTSISSIDIPDTVITIDNKAFQNCTNLSAVKFTNNSKLKNLGLSGTAYIFDNCPKLTSFTIPETVDLLGPNVFGQWNNSTPTSKITSLTFKSKKTFVLANGPETFTPSLNPTQDATNFIAKNHDCYLTVQTVRVNFKLDKQTKQSFMATLNSVYKRVKVGTKFGEIKNTISYKIRQGVFKGWADAFEDGKLIDDDLVFDDPTKEVNIYLVVRMN